jgi:hypothetical protein
MSLPLRALGEKTIRRMFEEEPSVLQWGSPETRRKRGISNHVEMDSPVVAKLYSF